MGPNHAVFVVEEDGRIVGTHYLRANQAGGGDHVANCGYIVDPWMQGRGFGRRSCEHSLDEARKRGFRAMRFNFVISTNERAVHLWRGLGFAVVGQLPLAFRHPLRGYVNALVMFQTL